MTYSEFLKTLANAYDTIACQFGSTDDAYMCIVLEDWSSQIAGSGHQGLEEAAVVFLLPEWNSEWETYRTALRKTIKETERDSGRCFADHIRSGRWGDNVNKARAKWLRELANKLN